MRFVRVIMRSVFKALEFVPFAGKTFRVTNMYGRISRLERLGKRDEARRLRHQAIEVTAKARSALLWRSEGEDLFYYKKDYVGALEAYENAIEALNGSAALYGVSNPCAIYGDASQAAVMAGEREAALKYYGTFAQWVEYLDKGVKSGPDLEWHHELLARLRKELGEPPPTEPL